MRTSRIPLLAAAVALTASACGSAGSDTATPTLSSSPAAPTGTAVIDPGDGGNYVVDIDPAAFSSRVDHPFFPMLPGSRWVYESTAPDGARESITVEVLDERREVMGVETIVVHDVVRTEKGEVVEDTYDWYAQDDQGNVWYFGEDTTSFEDGVASEAGAWEAGLNGALPGIAMPATPSVTGVGYRQEYFPGEAEDMGQVIAVSRPVTTRAGEFDDVIVTRDWTPLDPQTIEEKAYARGVGFVLETKPAGPSAGSVVELVEFTPGS